MAKGGQWGSRPTAPHSPCAVPGLPQGWCHPDCSPKATAQMSYGSPVLPQALFADSHLRALPTDPRPQTVCPSPRSPPSWRRQDCAWKESGAAHVWKSDQAVHTVLDFIFLHGVAVFQIRKCRLGKASPSCVCSRGPPVRRERLLFCRGQPPSFTSPARICARLLGPRALSSPLAEMTSRSVVRVTGRGRPVDRPERLWIQYSEAARRGGKAGEEEPVCAGTQRHGERREACLAGHRDRKRLLWGHGDRRDGCGPRR